MYRFIAFILLLFSLAGLAYVFQVFDETVQPTKTQQVAPQPSREESAAKSFKIP